MTPPRGNVVTMCVFVDADLAGDKLNRRSQTGILILPVGSGATPYSSPEPAQRTGAGPVKHIPQDRRNGTISIINNFCGRNRNFRENQSARAPSSSELRFLITLESIFPECSEL